MGSADWSPGRLTGMSARAGWIVAAACVALGCTLLPVLVANRQPDAGNLVVGLVLLVAGAELLAVPATRVSGSLLAAAAVAWFLPDVAPALPEVMGSAVSRAALFHVGLVIAAMVAPVGPVRITRRELAAGSAGVCAGASGVLGGYEVIVPLAGVVLLIVGLGRFARTRGQRRGRAYYLAALALLSAALIGVPIVRGLLPRIDEPLLSAGYGACLAGAGIALALAGDWCRRTHALDVGADGLVSLDKLVAEMAGDPNAQVIVRVAGQRWVGLDGRETQPRADPAEVTVDIVTPRQFRAAPDLEQALQLAARTVRARDDEATERRSLEGLRSRLVTVEVDERSALEARLRAGPLAALTIVESQLVGAGASSALLNRLGRVRGGIETLALGLDPLGGLSLANAVASLVVDCGGSAVTEPVDVDATAARALWFACSETLANATKHGAGSRPRVTLAATPDGALLTVTDDNRWSPGTRRGGLQGLEDRLAAVGGSMTIDPAAGGTSVTIRVPRSAPPSQHGGNPAVVPDPHPAGRFIVSYPPTSEVGT